MVSISNSCRAVENHEERERKRLYYRLLSDGKSSGPCKMGPQLVPHLFLLTFNLFDLV